VRALLTYARMIKLSHSIFALPFALAAGVLAARQVEVGWTQWALIVACMVTARSSAMGFNRLVDRDVDARNPRTANRELPAGEISVPAAWAFTLGSAALFVGCAAALGPLTLKLAPVALAIVWGYSLTKRFTALCHLVLGVAIGLSPVAVWVALTGSFSPVAWLLSLAVATWVAGFDIIYACQDVDFDRQAGLSSIPARLGLRGALIVSALLHVVTIAALASVPLQLPLGPAYQVGLLCIGVVLAYEHSLVTPTDLSRIDKAFFDLNGYVSLVFFGAVVLS
jgi:4-hydroxybenzoate polyprenyltransferase